MRGPGLILQREQSCVVMVGSEGVRPTAQDSSQLTTLPHLYTSSAFLLQPRQSAEGKQSLKVHLYFPSQFLFHFQKMEASDL